jgi:hypothetical protein
MKKNASERGSALLLVTIVTLIVVGVTAAYMSVSYINTQKSLNDVYGVQAYYIAESAAAHYVEYLNATTPTPALGPRPWTAPTTMSMVGGKNTPNNTFSMAGGTYIIPNGFWSNSVLTPTWVDYQNAPNNNDNFLRFQVWGTYEGITRKVEVLLSRSAGGVYWNAIFAGNSSGGAYSLSFANTGGNNDAIQGDVYVNGNFNASGTTTIVGETGSGEATITNSGSYSESISNNPNHVTGTQPGLTITKDGAGKSIWETKAEQFRTPGARTDSDGVSYIDVKYDLNARGTGGTWGSGNGNGGTAAKQFNGASDQTNEPSHIFRMNPTSTNGTTNRTETYESTKKVKDDFYLEDPTASGTNNRAIGNDASGNPIAINGDTSSTSVTVAPNGNNAVYFIDGNMRISGEPIKSYQLTKGTGTGDLKMTFVVKGNVSMTDNMIYPTYQSTSDAVAIIAVTDPAYPNVSASNFMSSGSALTAASGFTIAQFVADYNTRTQPARNAGRNIPALPTTDPSTWTQAQRDRAAQEYNKAYGSGNVYFGDPGSGTVEHFESFMYAENNFYATNLNSTTASGGTSQVEIFGNMTAGNQVNITREQFQLDGVTPAGYVPLKVKMDVKIKQAGSTPPALPSTPTFGSGSWFVANQKTVH